MLFLVLLEMMFEESIIDRLFYTFFIFLIRPPRSKLRGNVLFLIIYKLSFENKDKKDQLHVC